MRILVVFEFESRYDNSLTSANMDVMEKAAKWAGEILKENNTSNKHLGLHAICCKTWTSVSK
jgi:hypothetical protein